MPKLKTRSYLAIAITGLAIAGGSLVFMQVQAGSTKSATQAATAAASVDVAEVVQRPIIDWQNYSGRLEAIDRVEIRPLVSGTLAAVHFKDGQLVKKGDLLFTIDPRPFEAELARAQAQLAQADARAGYAASELARAQRLISENAIARRDLDEKQNAAREADAARKAAQAVLQTAQLNLGYARITAPVSGRISRAEITPGNIVTAGAASSPLTTLVSVSRLYAAFDVDEQSFLKYVHTAQGRDTEVPVHLGLANEEGYPRSGKVGSVDNRIDTSSGTIRVRAVFENPDGMLLPGLYARIRLGGNKAHEAVLIDEKAVGTDQDKRFVLVVDDKDVADYREIKLGARNDGLLVVQSGLKAGERIVVNGLQRVRPGDTVKPNLVAMGGPLPPAADKALVAQSSKP